MPAAFPGAIGDGADGAGADADAEGDGPRGAWLVAESAPSLFSNARLRTGGPPRGLPVTTVVRLPVDGNSGITSIFDLSVNYSST